MSLVTIKKTPQLELAVSGALLVARFADLWEVASIEVLMQTQRDLVKREGHVTLISLVPVSEPMGKISDEVKAKLVEAVRALGKELAGSATVILGKGMSVTILRTFLTGFNLHTRSPAPQRSFARVDEALTWLASAPASAGDLKGVDEAMISRHFSLEGAGKRAA